MIEMFGAEVLTEPGCRFGYSMSQVAFRLDVSQSPWRLLTLIAGLHPEWPIEGPGTGPGICISNKRPGDADASEPGPHLEDH